MADIPAGGGVDASIPLGLRPPGVNPLGLLNQFAETQNALNQNKLFQQTFAARQRAGQIIAGSPDMDTAIQGLMSDPTVAPFAGETINAYRNAQHTLTQIQGEQQTQATSGLTNFFKTGVPMIVSGADWDKTTQAMLEGLSPSARTRDAAAIDSLRQSISSNLSNDPTAATGQIKNRLVGMMLAGGFGSDAIQNLTGKSTLVDQGGQKVFGVQAPAQQGGGFTQSGSTASTGSLPMSLAPQVITGPYGPKGETTPVVVGGAGSRAAADNPLALTGGTAGLSSPNLANQQYLTKRGGDMADYQQQLDSRAAVGGIIQQTLGEAKDAFSQIKTGGGASTYTKLAQLTQAFGAPQDLVDKISNGNLAASQEAQKLMVNTTMGQIREQLQGVGASRLSQMEFAAFNQNNPNIDTDPRAVEKIFNFWTKLYQRDHDEQTELNSYIKKGGDISEWPAKWQDIAQQKGYIKPEITNKTTAPAGATHIYDPAKGTISAVPSGGP